ncbi:polysaccharide biosynthesis C-terminal domain-containing protein [Murdochiella sp. Marseille-P8839]|nr:polysaccharide biosynthesis C-terminal domain-containing protein [Murdochiella sp. Marseille-P8839]
MMHKKRQPLHLLEGPILPLLVRFAAPFVMTSLFTTVYTLTDLFWVGQVASGDAVAGIGMIGFVTWMADAIATGVRTGLGVVTAKNYGAGKDEETLAGMLSTGFQVALIASVGFFLFAQATLPAFVRFYGLGPTISEVATSYGRIVFIGMLFKMLHFSYAQAFQSFGDSQSAFWINFCGLVFNVVVDPLLIVGIGPFPALGVEGAAWATTLAQVGVFFLFRFVISRIGKKTTFAENPLAVLKRIRFFSPMDRPVATEVVRIGLPVTLLIGTYCIINLILSRMLAGIGALAVAVSTIGSQLESLNWMTADGFGAALTAMTAQNIGATTRGGEAQQQRVNAIMRTGIRLMTAIGLAIMLLFMFFGRPIFSLFLPGQADAIAMGRMYLLIFSISEPFIAYESAATACFNAFGKSLPPAINSVAFNLLRIPLGLLLMKPFGAYGIWLGMSLTSLSKGVVIALLLRAHQPRFAQAMGKA